MGRRISLPYEDFQASPYRDLGDAMGQFGDFDIDIKEKVTVVDHGADFILEQLRVLGQGMEITTGIQAEDFNKRAIYRGKQTNKTPLGIYAAMQEFGTKNTPDRPFMKKTLDNNVDLFLTQTVSGMRSIYNGNLTMQRLVDRQSKRTEKWMRATIKTWHTPPNTQKTIKAKRGQGSTPLRDTSTMLKNIKSKVKKEGGGIHRPLRKHMAIMDKKLTGSRK